MVWSIPEELSDRSISRRNLVGACKVGNCGKSSCSNGLDARCAEGSAVAPRRYPQREMTACRMTNNHDMVQIKVESFIRQRRKMIHCGCDVAESPGPAAAGRSQSPVLDVPDRVTPCCEVFRNLGECLSAVWHAPESAVKQAYNRWPGGARQVQIALLGFQRPVLKSMRCMQWSVCLHLNQRLKMWESRLTPEISGANPRSGFASG